MSVEAITWALKQPIKRSSEKFVLVAMANCANNDGSCFPSCKYLSEATSQDRKTVLANMQRLIESGHITDTGRRVGTTGQIIVYQLNCIEIDPAKESQKRNSTENGTVPFFRDNSTVFPVKESRFSAKESQKRDTEPSEPSLNRKGNKETARDARGTRLPDGWNLPDDWKQWAMEEYPAMSEQQIVKTSLVFADHWRSCAGSKGVKADWLATWRNWVRRDQSSQPKQSAMTSSRPSLDSGASRNYGRSGKL